MIDIHPVQFSLSEAVRHVLATELELAGIRGGTLYLGPGGAVQGQCFLLLIGGGRPPFSRASSIAYFLAPETARPAIREFISACPTNSGTPPPNGISSSRHHADSQFHH